MDHTDVTKALDRLRQEVHILEQMRSKPVEDPLAPAWMDQLVAQAKRVRAKSILLIKALARERDQLQPKEGTSA